MITKTQQRELADLLEMYANQIRENADDRRNSLPTSWALDDWLSSFHDLCQQENARYARQLLRGAT